MVAGRGWRDRDEHPSGRLDRRRRERPERGDRYNIGAITDASISGHTITLVGVGPSGQTVDTKFRTGAPGCS